MLYTKFEGNWPEKIFKGFLPSMGMVAILAVWTHFLLPTNKSSIWNLASMGGNLNLQCTMLSYVNSIYYILNKEIQEFLVKIKMVFLRSLEIYISSREINLCRLDTFPTMVANRPVMYNRVPAFGLLWILLCLQLQLYTPVIFFTCWGRVPVPVELGKIAAFFHKLGKIVISILKRFGNKKKYNI